VRARWLFGGTALAVTITAAVAFAQRGDTRRPLTVVVGESAGPASTIRSDAHRDGLARAAFPRAPLHVDWRFSVGGGNIEQPPVVSNEAIIVVTTHGDVVWVPHDAKDRNEIARQPIGIAATSSSAPALLSNGTVVVVGGSTDAIAVGVDKTGVRFRTQLQGAFPGESLDSVAPLALDDGGVAVATANEIALLDASGNVRVRAPIPEPLSGPLLASGGAAPSSRRIFAVSKTGVVYAWAPGGANGRDVSRVGSFQAPVQGGAVMTSDDTLLAIVGDSRMMTLDVRQGLAVPLASFTGGGYLGPVAFRRGAAYAMAGVPGRTFAIGVDSSGQEVLRVPVATSTVVTADGGAPAFTVPPHVPVAVDDTGTLAFAAPEGPVGVVDPAGIVTSIDGVCTRTLRNGRGVTSLVSGGPGAFIVTCATASVVRIVHGQGGGADSP
jgi:hypothetical protein